ncbi:MAG: hypothetical protein ACXAC8_09590 [Candidatus Hodarchaeales archaeon]|jgi:hypothetical protein
MTVNTKKYPFKWMHGIINVFKQGETYSPYHISRTIGSCFADAREVTRMVHYLTLHGKITTNGNEWKILHSSGKSDLPSPNFRYNFINPLVKIIETLSSEFQSVEELAKKTSEEIEDLREKLLFLETITSRGHLQLIKSNFPQKWGIKYWPDESS